MLISKYLHSCFLVEEQNLTILFDPGNFTYDAKALDINKITRLDYLLITHEHADHMYLPFVKEILHKFPDVKIISNSSVVKLLRKENIEGLSGENELVKFETAPHEKLWDKTPPENISISVFDKLTHAGDSLHFTKTCEILALPITAPWGSTTQAVEKALEIKPKTIIPIHDFMWKNEIRIAMYKRLEDFFKPLGIEFKGLEIGEIIKL